MDQSQSGHQLGSYDHGQFTVDYGFNDAEDHGFQDGNMNVVDPAYFAVDEHTSSVNTQGLDNFQQATGPYNFYPTHFGQPTSSSQQHDMNHFGFTNQSPPPTQSNNSHVSNTYHNQRVQSPALGNPLGGYQSLTSHQPHSAHQGQTGYQAPPAHNGYPSNQPHANYGASHTQNGHLPGSAAPQLSYQPYQHVSPSPQPYQTPQGSFPHQTGLGLGAQPALKGQHIPGTPTVPQPQPTLQAQLPLQTLHAQQAQQIPESERVAHHAPATQASRAPQPRSIPQPQPFPQPQAAPRPQPTPQPQPQPQPQGVLQTQPVPQTQSGLPNLTAQNVAVQAQPTVLIPDPWTFARPGYNPATDDNSSSWVETPNLDVSAQTVSVTKQKYQQTVSLFMRSDKKRLFPERSFYLPSESLGKFMDGLEAIQNLPKDEKESKRRELYCILRYDLRRADQHMDPDDLGKVIDKEAKHRRIETEVSKALPYVRESANADVGCEVAALLDIHPFWGADKTVLERIADDLSQFVLKHVELLRNKPEYKQLMAAVKARKDDPASVTQQSLKKLRSAVEPVREKVGRLLTVASQRADDRVLDELEEDSKSPQPAILVPLWNLALVCYNTGDPGSPLVKAVLDFSARISSLDDEFLGRVKFPQLAPKFETAGGEEVKATTAKIRAIAAKNPSATPSSVTTPTSGSTKATSSKTKTAASSVSSSRASSKISSTSKEMTSDSDSVSAYKSASAGASSKKRPLEEGGESSASKKTATGITRSDQRPGQPTEKPVIHLQSASRRAPSILPGRRPVSKVTSEQSKSRVGSSNADVAGEATKARITAANPPSSLSADTSKSRVGVSNPTAVPTEAVQTRASGSNSTMSSDPAKPRGSAAAPPQSASKTEVAQQSRSSSSSFSALLAEINEPKQVVRPTRTPEATSELIETEQERDRRLRKEKRRRLNLKVAFKADAELTEVRIFHKVDGEDEGGENNMTLDAADDKAEGKMLKASRRDQITLGREWEEPTMIDFSGIPEEQRANTFVTRGGLTSFRTEEQKTIAKEEMTELMVVYMDHGDIPPTPMSPRSRQPASDAPLGPELPPPATFNWRNRPAERLIFGATGQLDKAWNRKMGLEPAYVVPPSVALSIIEKAKAMQPKVPLDPVARDEAILQLLSSERAKNWVDPDPYNPAAPKTTHRTDYSDPQVQNAADFMQGIVRQFEGKPAISQEPPAWMKDSVRVDEWWRGYHADKRRAEHEQHKAEAVARQQAEQAALLAQAQAAAAQQQNPYAAYFQAQNQLQGAAPAQSYAQPGLDPQVQALLASLGQGQGQQQQAAPTAADPAVLLQLAQWSASQAQAPQAPFAAGYGGQDNGYGLQDENRREAGDREGRRGNRGRKEEIPDHLRGINRSLIGTKKCTFWAKGQCAKGDKCTFRHE